MRIIRIIFIELCAVLGVLLAALTLPRSTPTLTFAIVSVAVLLLINYFLFSKKQRQSKDDSNRSFAVAKLMIACALYWLFHWVLRK